MEGARDQTGQEETKLDLKLIEATLAANQLKGLVDMVELLTALHRVRTFEALMDVIKGPEYRQTNDDSLLIGTTNIALAHQVMGASPPGYNPTRYYLFVVGTSVRKLIPVLEEARQEALEKQKDEEEEDDINAQEEQSNKPNN